MVKAERTATCVFEHIYFSRPDSRLEGKVLQQVRGRMGEILWREAPVEADLVIAVPDSGNPAAAGLRARLGAAPRRRPDQEPLRRPHLHPARPGAAQARAAAEVQPAAGDRRRAADRRRRRLDRARQHHPPDRRHAARRRRQGGPPADLGAADPQPLPLRRRHVDPRGDDRPQPHDRGDRRRARRRLARLPLDGRASTRRSAAAPTTTATPASAATTRWATPTTRTASSPWRTYRSGSRQLRRRRAMFRIVVSRLGAAAPTCRRSSTRCTGATGSRWSASAPTSRRRGRWSGPGGGGRDRGLRRRRVRGPGRARRGDGRLGRVARGRPRRPRRLHAAAQRSLRAPASATG